MAALAETRNWRRVHCLRRTALDLERDAFTRMFLAQSTGPGKLLLRLFLPAKVVQYLIPVFIRL
jgi:hypothetical protein